MKFMKKAAALFFCLALAFSVMAITAAADEVQLLGTDTTYTMTFKVNSTKAAYDVNEDNFPDYKTGETGVIDIYLTGSEAVSVNGVQFALSVGSGVTVNTVTIGGTELTESNGVYQYLKEYNGGNLLAVPAGAITDSTTAIGSIAFTTNTVSSKTDVIFTATDVAVHETSITDKKDVGTITSATISVHPDYTITLMTYGEQDNGIKKSDAEAVKSGGSALTYTYNVTDGLPNPTTLPHQTLTHYTFGGWEISGSGHNWGSNDITVATATTDVDLFQNATYATGKYGDVTLTAIFTTKTYTVTYVPGTGATYTAPDPATYTIETQVNPGTNPTRTDGYSFDGWVASGGNWDGTTIYGASLYSTPDVAFPTNGKHGNVTLTAQWTPTTYNLTFKPGYGDGTPADETTTYNAGAAIVKANPTRDGYNFKGWTANISTGGWDTSAKYGTTYTSSGLASDGEITLTAFSVGLFNDVELTATWEANQYTMTFVPGHADVTITNAGTADDSGNYSVTFKTDSVTALNTVVATRDGWTFKGWNVTTGATGLSTGTTEATTPFTAGFYGNGAVVTPTWEINGRFVQIAYAFSDKQLTLVAVNTTNDNTATSAGYYKFGELDMYPVANRYATLCDGISSATGYVVYATLADSLADGADWKATVTFTKGDAITGPAYDGDVNGQTGVDVGDYGTAGTIFTTQSSYNAIATLQRLGMDMTGEEFDNDGALKGTEYSKIGSIHDLKAIMNVAAGLKPDGTSKT